MSKIILEFDGIEERQDARDALDVMKWKSVVWDLDQHLRSELKYNDLPDDVYEALEQLRERLRNLVSDNNLDL